MNEFAEHTRAYLDFQNTLERKLYEAMDWYNSKEAEAQGDNGNAARNSQMAVLPQIEQMAAILYYLRG